MPVQPAGPATRLASLFALRHLEGDLDACRAIYEDAEQRGLLFELMRCTAELASGLGTLAHGPDLREVLHRTHLYTEGVWRPESESGHEPC